MSQKVRMNWKQEQKNAEARKLQIQNGLLEVFVEIEDPDDKASGEHLLAYPIGTQYAQIASIPFATSDLGLDDIVEIRFSDDRWEFVRLLKKNTNTYFIQFSVDKNNVDAVSETVYNHFSKYGIRSDSVWPGLFSIAVPIYIENIEQIISDCPVALIIEEDSPE